MLPIVQQLLVLQERDLKIRSVQRELKDLPKLQQRAHERLAGAEEAVTNAKQKVTEVELKIKSLELDIQTRKTSISRLKDQQFNTRKNEEFQALGYEVKRYENDVTALEDKELEFMEQIEARRPELQAAQAKLAETKKDIADELAKIEERSKNLEARQAELKAERSELAKPVEPSSLALYDRLLKSKGDIAVVPMQNNVCGGCHMKMVLNTQLKVKAAQELAQCDLCGRILYLD